MAHRPQIMNRHPRVQIARRSTSFNRQSRRHRRLATTLLGFEALEDRRVLAPISWDGGAGTFNWSDAVNWSNDALPGSADDVVINAGNNMVVYSGLTTHIRSLSSSSAFLIDAGSSLKLTTDSTVQRQFHNNGTVEILSGTLDLRDGGHSTGSFLGAVGSFLTFRAAHTLRASSQISADHVTLDTFGQTIDIAGSYHATSSTIIGGNGGVNLRGSISSVGSLVEIGGGLDLDDNSISTAVLKINGGSLAGNGVVHVTERFDWNGKLIQSSGTINVAAGATMNLSTGWLAGWTINNYGDATWVFGSMAWGDGAEFNNYGSFDAQGNANPIGIGHIGYLGTGASPPWEIGIRPEFNNYGSFTRSSGTGEMLIAFNPGPGIAFNNSGSVVVESGTLNMAAGGTSSGTFVGLPGTTLVFGSDHILTSTSDISAVDVIFDHGGSDVSGSYEVTGRTFLNAAGVEFRGTVSNVGHLLDVNVSNLILHGQTIDMDTLKLHGADVFGTGTINVAQRFDWNGNVGRGGHGAGTLNVATGADLNILGGGLHQWTVNNYGDATSTATFFTIAAGAVFNNNGSFDIQGNPIFFHSGGGASFNNHGTFTRSSGSGDALFMFGPGPGIAFNNSGSVVVETGSVTFDGGYTQTDGRTLLDGGQIKSRSPFNFQAGGLEGDGAIIGDVGSNGITSPGINLDSSGLISVSQDFEQSNNGQLHIEIGGGSNGFLGTREYDQLDVTGGVRLAGSLEVSLFNDVEIARNQEFVIIRNAGTDAVIGSFQNTSIAIGPIEFVVLYNGGDGNDVVLKVVSVTPPVLTINANDRAKIYGDAVNFVGTEFVTDGLQEEDTVTGVTLTSPGAAASAPVGGSPYPIVASNAVGNGLEDYDIVYVDGSLTVNRKALTITVNNATWQIGTPFPQFTVNYDGFVLGQDANVLGDSLVFETPANSTSNVGTYTVTAGGLSSTNYAITFVPGTLTVTPQIVDINIRPESLNINQNGAISLVIHGSSTFDVAGISISSLEVVGVSIDVFQYGLIDGNSDGTSDLLLHFRTSDALKAALTEMFSDLLGVDEADDHVYSNRQDASIAIDGAFGDYGQEFEGRDSLTLFLAGNSLRTLLESLGI